MNAVAFAMMSILLAGQSYLYVWAGDEDEEDSDFLAVIDARRSEPTYGKVVATLPVEALGTMPHHTEYEFPAGGVLYANGWSAGRTFLLDLRNPVAPKVAGQFTSVLGYGYPHSFARLPNGNVIGTFQSKGEGYASTGGLVELDPQGQGVRASSAATTEVDGELIWPYSLTVLPAVDRIVSTSTDMGVPPWDEWTYHETRHVQVWSLGELKLLATVALPESGQGRHHIAPAEPRVLADGSVYVNTFSCGLYRVIGVASAEPTAEFIYAFPGGDSPETDCAVPVVYGKYWIQPVPALPGLIALDVSDPSRPVEAARLVLGERYPMPHWLAADRVNGRLVLTGGMQSWVLVVDFDESTGAMRLDEKFREEGSDHPGVDFNRPQWAHGPTGAAQVHGALFGN